MRRTVWTRSGALGTSLARSDLAVLRRSRSGTVRTGTPSMERTCLVQTTPAEPRNVEDEQVAPVSSRGLGVLDHPLEGRTGINRGSADRVVLEPFHDGVAVLFGEDPDRLALIAEALFLSIRAAANVACGGLSRGICFGSLVQHGLYLTLGRTL